MIQEKIEEILMVGKRDRWPYPKVFDALKAAGVDSYEAQVSTHQITYFGGDIQFQENPPVGFTPIIAAPKFDEAGVKKALNRVQTQQIDYPAFLQEMASAGIFLYRVSMAERTVTYKGPNNKTLIEKVPVMA